MLGCTELSDQNCGRKRKPRFVEALYYAYHGGAWNAHTHATKEHLADITGGLAHTKQQHGRNNGSKNKKSKVKEKGQADDEYARKKNEIVELWCNSPDHSAYAFMDKLVDRGLAGEDKSEYQVAGKGKYLSASDATRKIREWAK